MSERQGFAGKTRAGWRLGAVFSSIIAAAMLCSAADAASWRVRNPAGAVAPAAVALAAIPQTSTIADLQTRDAQTPWPTHGWAASTPEEQGIDSDVLAAALENIRARNLPVHSLLIERHGKIVLDAYFAPFADNELHDVNSVTKSVISTLVGIAMRDRRIADLNAPVLQMLPEESAGLDWRKGRLTLSHMLSMTSGLDCGASNSGNFLQQMEQSPHWTQFALSREQVAEPGVKFTYCPGNMQVASAVLTRAVGETAESFAQRELFAPLGIEHVSWATDRDGVTHGFSDLRLQPRDMAKLGYLWLHRGVWEGRQIVPASYLAAAFAPHIEVGQNVDYGYGMWIYPNVGHAGGAPDFEANGFGGQRIAVIPSQDMVIVTTGSGLDANKVTALLNDAARPFRFLPRNFAGESRLNAILAEVMHKPAMRLASLSSRTHAHTARGVRTAALGL